LDVIQSRTFQSTQPCFGEPDARGNQIRLEPQAMRFRSDLFDVVAQQRLAT
jgi:hypothetical protein